MQERKAISGIFLKLQEEREVLEKYEEAKQKKGKKEEEKVEEKTKLHSMMFFDFYGVFKIMFNTSQCHV